MKNNFKSALKHVLVHEGGWADHPKDPGGATMKGVTLATYRRYFSEDKSKDNLHNISAEELEEIYRSGYWNKCRCDKLPPGVDYAVFDAAVNSGPGRGMIWLQAAVGAKQDGGIGPNTLSRVEEQDPLRVTDDMCDRRLTFLRSLSTWPTFGKGWGRRVEGVRTIAIPWPLEKVQPLWKSLHRSTTKLFKRALKGSGSVNFRNLLKFKWMGNSVTTPRLLSKLAKKNMGWSLTALLAVLPTGRLACSNNRCFFGEAMWPCGGMLFML